MAAVDADSVARQLHFSPAAAASAVAAAAAGAGGTPPRGVGGLQSVQQQLDARLASAAGRSRLSAGGFSAAAADDDDDDDGAATPPQQGFYFCVPSDDEDDIYEAVDDFLPTPAHLFSAPGVDAAEALLAGGGWGQQPALSSGNGATTTSSFSAPSSAQPCPVESVLWAHNQALQATALRHADSRKQVLHSQLQEVEQQLAQQLLQVQQQLEQKRAAAAAADEQSRLQRSAERQQKLHEVQQHQAALQAAHATALQEAARKQQEAAARRQAEEAAAAAAAAAAQLKQQQAEEEQRRREAAAAAAKAAEDAAKAAAAATPPAQAAAAAAAQQQQLPAGAGGAAAAPQAAPAAAVTADASGTIATAGALEYEAKLRAQLDAAEAAAAQLAADPALKPARRKVEKSITMWVSQISGTQQQVQDKSRQLIELLKSCSSEEEQALAYLTLAGRVLSQIEVQVVRLGTFAFPLAYVCVAVGAAVPRFMELLLAKMQQACPLLVPKHTRYRPGADKGAYLKSLGYKVVDDPKTGEKRLETHDEYVARMSAIALLYASIVQTEAPGNPAGLAHGWAWLARVLNSLPPTRPSASALMAFLAHAGFRMASVYGRQFTKALAHILHHFLPALEAKAVKNPDLRAVGTRLHTYVSTRGYTSEPEGRSLKRVDESQYTRA